MMPHRYMFKCPICDRKDVLNIVRHLKTIHNVNTDDWLSKAKLLNLIILQTWPLPNQKVIVYVEWAKKMVPCKFRDDFWRPI